MSKYFHDMITNFQKGEPDTLGLDPAKYRYVSHMYEYIQTLSWETQYRLGIAMLNYVHENGTMAGFDPAKLGL